MYHALSQTKSVSAVFVKISHLQSACNKKSVFLRELQQSQECVMSHLAESLRKREEAWSSQHTHTVASLQKELQVNTYIYTPIHTHTHTNLPEGIFLKLC